MVLIEKCDHDQLVTPSDDSESSCCSKGNGRWQDARGRRVEIWGGLATAWSAYDGRTASGSFHERGINSIQLVKVDGKWLVASILWQEETPENRLPASLVKWSKK